MKKILYFTKVNFNDKNMSGVTKKIIGQLNAFKALEYKVDIIYIKGGKFFFNDEEIVNNRKNQTFWSLTIKKFIKPKNLSYSKIYIRGFSYLPTYTLLFTYLSKISNNNLYFEIPTYPYYGEVKKTLEAQLMFLLHQISILFTKKYIKKVVTSQFYDKIWGIPTIKIVNGIDTTLPSHNNSIQSSYAPGNDLKLIAVANISFWHGFDRLLYGLSEYYKEKNHSAQKIHLTFVGEEVEKEKLMQIAQQERLEKYVTFLPAKTGEALQKEYAKAHVGIGTLGLYRINLDYTSTLKSIEYLYQGIPFISGYIDPKFQGKDFYHAFPNDDTPIDIHKLIHWRDKVKTSPEEMAQLAIEKYSWIAQMRKIVKDV